MSSHRFPLAAVVVLIGAPLPATTAAQAIPAACRPLLDAQRKSITTPHHLYSTDGPAGQSAKARADEMISAGGVSYLLYQGKWRRSPITPKEQVDQLQENIGVPKAPGCYSARRRTWTPAAVASTTSRSATSTRTSAPQPG